PTSHSPPATPRLPLAVPARPPRRLRRLCRLDGPAPGRAPLLLTAPGRLGGGLGGRGCALGGPAPGRGPAADAVAPSPRALCLPAWCLGRRWRRSVGGRTAQR